MRKHGPFGKMLGLYLLAGAAAAALAARPLPAPQNTAEAPADGTYLPLPADTLTLAAALTGEDGALAFVIRFAPAEERITAVPLPEDCAAAAAEGLSAFRAAAEQEAGPVDGALSGDTDAWRQAAGVLGPVTVELPASLTLSTPGGAVTLSAGRQAVDATLALALLDKGGDPARQVAEGWALGFCRLAERRSTAALFSGLEEGFAADVSYDLLEQKRRGLAWLAGQLGG